MGWVQVGADDAPAMGLCQRASLCEVLSQGPACSSSGATATMDVCISDSSSVEDNHKPMPAADQLQGQLARRGSRL